MHSSSRVATVVFLLGGASALPCASAQGLPERGAGGPVVTSSASGLPDRGAGGPVVTPAAGSTPAGVLGTGSAHGNTNPNNLPSTMDQAERARTAGDHGRAGEIAERASHDTPTAQTFLFAAEEFRADNQPLPALRNADRCVRDAVVDTSLRGLDATLTRCRAIADEMRPHVSMLVIRVQGTPPPGMHVRLNNEPFEVSQLGTAVPVSAGVNFVAAHARGMHTASQTLYLSSGQQSQVELTFTPLAAGETPDVDPDAEAAPLDEHGNPLPEVAVTTGADAVHDALNDREGPQGPGAGPWVLVGLGVAGVGTSIALYVLRANALGTCAVTDTQVVCPDYNSYTTARPAPGYAIGGLVSAVGGGALVAGGILWFALAHRAPPRRGHASIDVLPSATPTSLTLNLGVSL